MSDYTQRGFIPCRTLDGGEVVTKTFRVSAGDNIAYFQGDAVTLGASGRLKPIRTTGAAVYNAGVIIALQKDSGGKPSPLTFNQPTRGPYLATAQEGYATVILNPHQTYTVQIDANITEASFGAGAKVSAGAPNTANGLSGHTLTGVTTSASDAHFQIIGLAPVEMLSTRTSAASPVLVEVIASKPILGNLV
jgi:hypothetical protein